MSNVPPSPYPEQDPPYPLLHPTQPAFPPLQPGYVPPGYPQAPTRPGRRLWIVLAAVLVLLLAGGAFFTYLQVRSTPQKTLQAYCDALKANDAEALYNTLSSSARAQTSVPQLRQGLRLVEFLVGGVKDCTVNADSIQQDGATATGTVTIVTSRGRSMIATIRLLEEHSQWSIDGKTTNAGVP